jgi:hypothetical protein
LCSLLFLCNDHIIHCMQLSSIKSSGSSWMLHFNSTF